VRGPNVVHGYWNSPETNAAAFNEDRFFRTGDAVIFSDLDDSAQGLIFNGRTTEYFKLLTGIWVDAAAVPLLADAASAGLITDVGDGRPPGRGRCAGRVIDPDVRPTGQGFVPRSSISRKRPARHP
jgi:hypothetical protein